MTDEFRRLGLIENEHLEEYDGTTSVVRNEHLSANEIEYLRWKAERGMKTRHIPTVFLHDPWFVTRNVVGMAAPHLPRLQTSHHAGTGRRASSLHALQRDSPSGTPIPVRAFKR